MRPSTHVAVVAGLVLPAIAVAFTVAAPTATACHQVWHPCLTYCPYPIVCFNFALGNVTVHANSTVTGGTSAATNMTAHAGDSGQVTFTFNLLPGGPESANLTVSFAPVMHIAWDTPNVQTKSVKQGQTSLMEFRYHVTEGVGVGPLPLAFTATSSDSPNTASADFPLVIDPPIPIPRGPIPGIEAGLVAVAVAAAVLLARRRQA